MQQIKDLHAIAQQEAGGQTSQPQHLDYNEGTEQETARMRYDTYVKADRPPVMPLRPSSAQQTKLSSDSISAGAE